MTLKNVQRDDVVEVDIKGRRFRADVEDVDGGRAAHPPAVAQHLLPPRVGAPSGAPLAPGGASATLTGRRRCRRGWQLSHRLAIATALIRVALLASLA
jgi:hypothetical protein